MSIEFLSAYSGRFAGRRLCLTGTQEPELARLARLCVSREPNITSGLGWLLGGRWMLTCQHVVPATDDIEGSSWLGNQTPSRVLNIYLEGQPDAIPAADWPVRAIRFSKPEQFLNERLVVLELASPVHREGRLPEIAPAVGAARSLVGAAHVPGLKCRLSMVEGLAFQSLKPYECVVAPVPEGFGGAPTTGDSGGPILESADTASRLCAIQNAVALDKSNDPWAVAIPVGRALAWIQSVTGIRMEAP
ncbi:MAG: hypothetical protein AMXMBFR25_14930 [Lysobacterales bacterium]|nr:hypothetical protein [Xanthomonadales bacterium]